MDSKQAAAASRKAAGERERVDAEVKAQEDKGAALRELFIPPVAVVEDPNEDPDADPPARSERENTIDDYHHELRQAGQLQYVRRGQLPTSIPYAQPQRVKKG